MVDAGQGEAKGFAGSGLGDADDVIALKGNGNGFRLDRCGRYETLFPYGIEYSGIEFEVCECCHMLDITLTGLTMNGSWRIHRLNQAYRPALSGPG